MLCVQLFSFNIIQIIIIIFVQRRLIIIVFSFIIWGRDSRGTGLHFVRNGCVHHIIVFINHPLIVVYIRCRKHVIVGIRNWSIQLGNSRRRTLLNGRDNLASFDLQNPTS
uniref:Uncharacterized protein n=1 Tax=Opuntia streptacantha TaxID=393608 RepID=A0A7C9CPP3_OPUST